MVGKLLDNRLSIINAALSTNSTYKKKPSEYYKNTLQSKINTEFERASDVFTIQEELVVGSNELTDVAVRITHVLSDKGTGEKLGDDWRNIIFKDLEHAYGLGHMYFFNDFYWLTINTDRYKYVTASCTIRRCNYTLKWLNDVGGIEQAPCIIDYYKFTTGNNVDESNYIRIGDKTRYATLQNNNINYKILRDKRFILDKISYRVVATDSITKPGLYMLTLEEFQNNYSTDLIYPDGTGIANYYGASTFSIELSTTNISLSIGGTSTLSWVVKQDGVIINDKSVNIESNENFVSISNIQNNSCTVNAIANGSGTIRVSLYGNDSIYAEIPVLISSTPSQIVSEVIEGSDSINVNESATYTIYKLINGVNDGSTYTFSLNNSLASLNNITGNSVKVEAKDILGTTILKAINNITLDEFTININIQYLW